jgi:hypothetical protein
MQLRLQLRGAVRRYWHQKRFSPERWETPVPYASEDVSANLMQWSTDGSTGYDLQTISLHGLGHFVGLDDLHCSSASDEVMYGYCNGVDGDPYIGDKAGIPTPRFSRFNINISNTPNRSSIDLPYPRRQLLSRLSNCSLLKAKTMWIKTDMLN